MMATRPTLRNFIFLTAGRVVWGEGGPLVQSQMLLAGQFEDGGGRERVELCALPLGFFDARATRDARATHVILGEAGSNFQAL